MATGNLRIINFIKIFSLFFISNNIFANNVDDELTKLISQQHSSKNHQVKQYKNNKFNNTSTKSNKFKNNNKQDFLDEAIAKVIESEKQYHRSDIIVSADDKNFDGNDFSSLLLSSKAAVIQDLNTGRILYDKNSNSLRSIASISKLMSAIVILDANINMDELVVITDDDVDKLKNSSSRLKVGTILSRRQLLHLGLMSSENRAIHALSRTYPGGINNFVAQMNAKAYQLGMYDTIFFEPTGLDPRNKSTANDLLLLAKQANSYNAIRKYSTSNHVEITTSSGVLQEYKNSNVLIREGLWDIRLQKTGYIKEAGRCMVVMANLYGRPILIVLLGAPDSKSREKDALRTEEWLTTTNL